MELEYATAGGWFNVSASHKYSHIVVSVEANLPIQSTLMLWR